MLIEDYTVRRIPGGCADDHSRVSIQASLPVDVSAVYPHVNARLEGCAYNHAGRLLEWQEGAHKVVLRADNLAISNLPDWDFARAAMARLVAFLNDTWQRRAGIGSRLELRPQATPLAVFKLLPGSNCRACGQPTCYSFALKLVARDERVESCAPMLEAARARDLTGLREMLAPPPVVLSA